MLKALLVPVLATGLALGGTAKQAEALTAEEAAAILAGLAIVGVIASSNNNNRASASTRSTRYYDRYDGVRRGQRDVLPAQCVRRFDTNRGVRNLAVERCLQRNGVRTARLPDRCEVRVRTDRGIRAAYRQRCRDGG